MTAIAEGARNCTDAQESEAYRLFCEAIGLSEDMIPTWNDHPSRTLADVLAAFDRAIEMSREEETP
jgi:hypothetical protein